MKVNNKEEFDKIILEASSKMKEKRVYIDVDAFTGG